MFQTVQSPWFLQSAPTEPPLASDGALWGALLDFVEAETVTNILSRAAYSSDTVAIFGMWDTCVGNYGRPCSTPPQLHARALKMIFLNVLRRSRPGVIELLAANFGCGGVRSLGSCVPSTTPLLLVEGSCIKFHVSRDL